MLFGNWHLLNICAPNTLKPTHESKIEMLTFTDCYLLSTYFKYVHTNWICSNDLVFQWFYWFFPLSKNKKIIVPSKIKTDMTFWLHLSEMKIVFFLLILWQPCQPNHRVEKKMNKHRHVLNIVAIFFRKIPANNDKSEAINCVHCKTQKSTIAQLRFISLKVFCSENCSVINI